MTASCLCARRTRSVEWAVFYSASTTTARRARSAIAAVLVGGDAGQAQRELARVGVDGHSVMAQEGVTEDAVDTRTGLVQHDGDVAERGAADVQRTGDRRGASCTTAECLQLDALASRRRRHTRGGRERGSDDDHACTSVEQEAATMAVDRDRHDPDAEPGLQRDHDLAVRRRVMQACEAV